MPEPISSQPITPHKFIGQAHIDRQAVSAGTEVNAFADGQQVASATVTDNSGAYILLVAQPSVGQTITFQINGRYARETATRQQGAISYPFNLHTGGYYSPEQVFAPLISDGTLEVVWHYDNTTQTWSSFAPNVPTALNDLTHLAAGDIVWLQLTADREFQEQSLKQGLSLIALR